LPPGGRCGNATEPGVADVNAQRSKDNPIAVVQLINKNKGDSQFDLQDEEILSVLLRFIGPLIKNSTLFVKKKKKTEASIMANLSKHQISRQPSKTFGKDLDAVVIEEDGEEEEEDEFKDDK